MKAKPKCRRPAKKITKAFSSFNKETARIFRRLFRKMMPARPRNTSRRPSMEQGSFTSGPTIRTAEAAAAAKTFLEQHYANININYENFTRDPTHLRKLRVLKTKRTSTTQACPYVRTGLRLQRALGKGSFGLVELVKEANSGRMYAMKIMHKSAMINNGQEAHLKCERDLLVQFAKKESNWIVPLVQSFQDSENLYLVMSFMEGGDFLGLLLREEILAEHEARFYVAEMISAVEEVHKMGWIHRDLKPDNFLIDAQGHLKLSDFGLAFSPHWSHQMSYYSNTRAHMCERLRITIDGDETDKSESASFTPPVFPRRSPGLLHGYENLKWQSMCCDGAYTPTISDAMDQAEQAPWRRDYARSCVGTSQYMAPEVIAGESYNQACDWWSIGCILYECIYGQTPFYDSSRDRVKRKALHWQRHFRFSHRERIQRPHTTDAVLLPPASDSVQNLLTGLICNAPQRMTGHEIKYHVWFGGLNWDADVLCKMPAPWIPAERAPEDIAFYFEPEEQIGGLEDKWKRPRDKILRDPVSGPVAMDVRKQTAFMGYTFRRSDMMPVARPSLESAFLMPPGSAGEHGLKIDVEVEVQEEQLAEMGEIEAVQWMQVANHVVNEMRCGMPMALSV